MLGQRTVATPRLDDRDRISVRTAKGRDRHAIHAIEKQGDHVDPYDEAVISRVLRTDGIDCCIGTLGYATVGWGCGIFSTERSLYEIGKIVVLPQFRRMGVGRAILGHLCAAAYHGNVNRARWMPVRATLSERDTAGLCFLRDCGFGHPEIVRDWFDRGESAVHQFYRPR